MRPFTTVVAVTAALLLSGCIVLDEVTTISVHPDGSASLVVYHFQCPIDGGRRECRQ